MRKGKVLAVMSVSDIILVVSNPDQSAIQNSFNPKLVLNRQENGVGVYQTCKADCATVFPNPIAGNNGKHLSAMHLTSERWQASVVLLVLLMRSMWGKGKILLLLIVLNFNGAFLFVMETVLEMHFSLSWRHLTFSVSEDSGLGVYHMTILFRSLASIFFLFFFPCTFTTIIGNCVISYEMAFVPD